MELPLEVLIGAATVSGGAVTTVWVFMNKRLNVAETKNDTLQEKNDVLTEKNNKLGNDLASASTELRILTRGTKGMSVKPRADKFAKIKAEIEEYERLHETDGTTE